MESYPYIKTGHFYLRRGQTPLAVSFFAGNLIFIASYLLLHAGTVPAFYKVRGLLRSGWDVWYNARMGLVKTRRLAAMHPPSLKLPPSPRLQWTSRRTRKRQRAKAGMKLPMKGDIRRITNRSTITAMCEAERIAENHFVPKYSTRESFVRSLEA